MKVFLIKWLSA